MRLLPPALALLLAGAAIAQRDGGPIRPGPWQTAAKIPPGWVVHNTKNYQVQSECGLEKARRLGDHMETMNKVYRDMFKPDKAGAKQQTIKLFKDRNSFLAYGAPDMAAAYYSSGDREMVCYDTGKWADEALNTGPTTGQETAADRLARRMKRFEDLMKMDLLGCAAHEGWHQYFHWYVGSTVDLPSWINEGMGDYFYSAAPREKKGKVGQVTLGNDNDARMPVIRAAHRQDRLEPIPKFLGMLQNDYYSNPSVCYAQGWALCQFLLHYEVDGKKKYAHVIPLYIRTVKNDTNVEALTAKAFKGIDLAELEKEFKAWIGTLKDKAAETLAEAAAEHGGSPPPEAGAPPVEEPPPAPPEPPPAGGGNGNGGGNGGNGGGDAADARRGA